MASPSSGSWAEDLVAARLIASGADILARNWRCREGELDIVARQGELLLFVEVRARRRRDYGGPLASITPAKRRRLLAAAARYLATLSELPPCRFDCVGVHGTPAAHAIDYCEGAFGAE